jgi:hypothetical protein
MFSRSTLGVSAFTIAVASSFWSSLAPFRANRRRRTRAAHPMHSEALRLRNHAPRSAGRQSNVH